eukprot:12025815-Heterocapsa_arctica.AAC.1
MFAESLARKWEAASKDLWISKELLEKRQTNEMPADGVFIMKGNNLNQPWKHWNESSEEYLAQKEGKTGDEYYGRGRPIQYVKNTISAPQDKSDGSAITAELRTQQEKLSKMKIQHSGKKRKRAR